MKVMKMTGHSEAEFQYFSSQSYSGTHYNYLRVITVRSDSSVPLKPSLPGWKYYCHANENPSHYPKSTLHWT